MRYIGVILLFSVVVNCFSQLTVKLKIRRYSPNVKRYRTHRKEQVLWIGQNRRVIKWHEQRLVKSGYSHRQSRARSQIWIVSLMTIAGLSGLISGQLMRGFVSAAFLEMCFVFMTNQAARGRTAQFNMAVYKVYRALSLQLTSGMSMTESLKRIHHAVEAPFMREALYAYASTYLKTMDVDKATLKLTESIEGQEVEILAAVLRQGITSGDYYALLEKQEKIMLRQYYQAIEVETQWIRAKGILLAVGISLLIFVLLLLPILYEMHRATRNLFSS